MRILRSIFHSFPAPAAGRGASRLAAARPAFALLLTMAVTTTVGVWGSAAWAASLAVTVDPAAGLLDGQYVEVAWTGYPAGSNILLAQCAGAPAKTEDCTKVSRIAKTASDGTGSASFQVKTGDFPEGFSCNAEKACSIGAFWGDFGEQPPVFSQGAFGKIAFAFPLSSCPPPSGQQIVGSGSSSAFQAILRWESEVCREPSSLNVQYTVKNSIEGLEDFAAGNSDFAVSALPLTPEHLEAPAGREFLYAASSLSGVAFGYTIFDTSTSAQVENLKLSPKLVAEIFTGAILNPSADNRPDGIKALNPGVSFPTRLRAVGRADKAASTYYMTSWFNAVAKEAYEAGGEAYRGGATSIYPSTGDIALVTGGEEVAKTVGPRADTVVATIGWMDSSWASFYGLPMAAVANPAGQYVAPMDPGALAAGAEAAAAKSPGGFPMPDYSTGDPKAYSLPMVNHFVAPKNTSAAKVPVMRSFFNFAVGDGQKALPGGYAPLPEPMAASSRDSIGKIEAAPGAGNTAALGQADNEVSFPLAPEDRQSAGEQAPGESGGEASEGGGDLQEEQASGIPGFSNDSAGFDGSPADTVLAGAPSSRAPRPPAPSLVRRLAGVIGKAGPLLRSGAWTILPALAITAAGCMVLGPALGLPAWGGSPSAAKLRNHVIERLKR